MDEKIVDNLKSESRWLRLVFMVLFSVAAYFAGFLVMLVALVQVIHGFVVGEQNRRLLQLSAGINQYIFQIASFLTFNRDEKPYPFSDWPQPAADASDES